MTDPLSWMRPKLAELCGLWFHQSGAHKGTASTGMEPIGLFPWDPTTYVAQAVRCLEASGYDADICCRHGRVSVFAFKQHKKSKGRASHKTLSAAICLAIADALGWEKP